MNFPLYKIVEVCWNDANARSKWGDVEDYLTHDVVACKTVGYLLKRSKNSITIVSTQADGGGLNGAISIPAPWMTKFTVLRK